MGAYPQTLSFMDEAMQKAQDGTLKMQPIWLQASAITYSDAYAVPMRSQRLKRLFDITFIMFCLPLWLPLALLVSFAIKIDSNGPVIFRQQRTGLNGKVFSIYKFRTMHYEECLAHEVRQSQKADNRHTRVGRFLRRTSLDELPQLLNVLKGDMSLIGPRPHARYHDQLFVHCAEHYAARFRMRPGITGWAQVHGHRGLLETQEQLQRRTDYDNDYIMNWSLWMDIQVLFKTILVVFKGTNAH